MSLFSGSTPLNSITEVLSTTPPITYFLCLVAAGIGIPISEDAMCIFAGTILPTIWTQNVVKRNRLILALYGGVVLSDIITFTIGRVLRMGVLEPIRTGMNLRSDRVPLCEDEIEDAEEDLMDFDSIPEEFCAIATPKARKRDQILEKLESAGNYAGFIIRLSVGFRGPMMMFAGFSGKVPYLNFIAGTSVGALCSLSAQLLLGYTMRNNPAAVVAAVASISTFVAVVPFMIACAGWVSLMWNRYQLRERI
jgi:membrane protein DedA with SNARE-associated domain